MGDKVHSGGVINKDINGDMVRRSGRTIKIPKRFGY